MKSFSTIMYALDLAESQFWLGEVNAEGEVTGFTDFTFDQPVPRIFGGENMFYYVQAQDDNGEISIHVVQWYGAYPKKELQHRSIASMVEDGTLDPIATANSLLALHRKPNLN